MTDAGFYRAFEDRHRGSRELIRERLKAYVPFIKPLQQLSRPAKALDLGCGRGEWLELLLENGFHPMGIDLDAGMLEACTKRDLEVIQGDAIEYLKSISDSSLSIVSAFHVVEHISFDSLDTLVKEALRVLKPGGLLILETPNPENLVVGTCNFYLDPTHVRPIPPALLSFVPEYYGFERVSVLRLQEDPSLHQNEDLSLIQVLAGVSPDYAVIAQKKASSKVLAMFDKAFAGPYGIDLDSLSNRYDQSLLKHSGELNRRLNKIEAQSGGLSDTLARLIDLQERLIESTSKLAQTQIRLEVSEGEVITAEARAEEAETRAEEAEARAAEAEARAAEAETRAAEAETRAEEAETRAEEAETRAEEAETRAEEAETRAEEAETRAEEAETRAEEAHALAWQAQKDEHAVRDQLLAIRNSWSWRLTLPLRKALDAFQWTLRLPIRLFSILLDPILRRSMSFVLHRPRLRRFFSVVLQNVPFLYWRLFRAGQRANLPVTMVPKQIVELSHAELSPGHGQEGQGHGARPETLDSQPDLSILTPRARQIYADLKAAIEAKKDGDTQP